MSRFTQKIAEMIDSPLVGRLALGFSLIVLINIGFAAVFSLQAVHTESQVAREYRMIRAVQRVSDIADKLRRHRVIVDNARFYPEANRVEHDFSCNRIKRLLRRLKDEWQEAELPAADCRKLTEIVEKICATTPYLFIESWSKDKRKGVYSSFLNQSMDLYKESTRVSHELNEKIKQQGQQNAGSDSLTLCLAAIVFNGVVCVAALYAMVKGITGPLSRLAAACEHLISGEVIPAPRSRDTEIGELEETFHNMSSTISSTERARKELLRQMHDVHEVTLEHAKKCVDELASTFGDKPERDKHFALMKSNIDGMLLLLSSMTYGLNFNLDEEVKVVPTKCSTTELIKRTSNTVDWLMKKSKLQLVIEDPEVKLEVDEQLIQRVLINLISNAAKYAPNRSQIKLDVIEVNDGLVRFEIRDTGCGIAPGDLEKLFQKYMQIDSADGVQRSGSGLGLLICKKIVEAHGGEIGCDSVLGKGTCFWFTIPRVLNAARVPELTSAQARDRSGVARHRATLRRTLFALVALYVVCQIGIALSLGSQLDIAKKTYASYTRHKNTILVAEELLTESLTWRENAASEYLARNLQGFFDMLPLLKQQIEKAQNLLTVVEPNSDIQKNVKLVVDALTKLYDTAAGVLDIGSMTQEEKDKCYQEADRLGYVIEDSLFWILGKERSALPRSYDLASELRSKILLLLAIATVLNVVVLLLVCWSGVKIINKVSELNKKAATFAEGVNLVPTLPGNDELAFLDSRLCDVAQKMRSGQMRRQELMAVINHDLRTPLGTLLAGFEVLNSGMLGDIDDETEKLIERTETEVRGVLSAINEFLDADKGESVESNSGQS